MRRVHFAILLSAVTLAACSNDTLRTLSRTDGTPEEFGIVPNQPLEQPPSFAELPPPRPGGTNRADQQPLGDAVAALGGNPAALNAGAVPAADGALLSAVGRFGTNGNIRAVIAEEDEAFRARARLFNWRLVPDNEYERAYRAQSLDPYLWLERVRQPGGNIATPSAPPPGG
ncbi:Beta-barrel assembly machine subunit BamF [Roseivivax lentus]|uniref:Beta-barrel assembly machine subunit BamF n=2 Tax=Roseivivax lentus TaxID=633194 RepID=A0A1N7JZL8_9RHOB|nr:Beta-barrel assembly machine subunit BamF [Roseivivax lentus]